MFEIWWGDVEMLNFVCINVYNLFKNIVNCVGDEFLCVVVLVGYEGGCGLLFDGFLI